MNLFRDIALTIQRRFNDFDPAADFLCESRPTGEASPIVLLSPPRSGSTLVYQYLIDSFDLAFISNLMALLPRYMLRIQRVLRHWPLCRHTALHPGHYGFVPGLCAPAEAGKVMDYWFSLHRDDVFHDKVRRTAISLETQWGAPLVIKAPSLSLMVDRVNSVFPKARVILLTRDPAYIAQSLLIGRTQHRIPSDQWHGVEPEGFSEQHVHGPVYQTVWQVREILRLLETGITPTVQIDYADFCKRPHAAMRHIAESCGLDASARLHTLPTQFHAANQVRVAPEIWKQIVESCEILNVKRTPNAPMI